MGENMRHNEIISTLQNLTKVKPRQKDLALATGLSINTIGNRAVRNSDYNTDELKLIGKYFNVDLFKSLTSERNLSENEIILDYYPEVFGSCGNGTFVLSECKEPIAVPRKCFTSFVGGKQYSVINAYGDSMMPYIHDKDKLIVEHWSGEQIRDNRVYVFRFGDNIFVKRLVQNINQIVVKSDNTIYDTMKIEAKDAGDLQIIGRIVGLMRDMD